MAERLKKFQQEHAQKEGDEMLYKTILHGDQLTKVKPTGKKLAATVMFVAYN